MEATIKQGLLITSKPLFVISLRLVILTVKLSVPKMIFCSMKRIDYSCRLIGWRWL
ncbi:hypothetical protein SAMN05518847_10563 [Paenibacillus sp. OV219]|nr:hypothetical protein SAMN05518847_10563 [Paenibacillus sp. OV219]